ncbi:hypothetical protein [Lentzea sp. NEAU-D7]|uniref:hypothetical protein n=1 Tax=Lentzea sp. NEAU-D7 TaxID=2994667 RepID=UPI00224AC729|nr:hypothetical protein [Lentzea sp. NEAU-D7]MCX2946773.1 hypothetical protein [Lentzea sp. NEAU-D7]
MTRSTQRTAAQWVLLCLLVLGVIGMHHVNAGAPGAQAGIAATAGAHGGHHAPDDPEPAPAHDMSHMCMAILCAVVSLLLLGWSLLRLSRPPDDRAASAPAWPRAPARPPPLGGRGVLTSLCVLRL